jgi:hypothetical protein
MRRVTVLNTSPAAAGEGDHEVVEGALPAHGPSAPSVTFGDTSPVRCRYGGGF